MILINYDNTIGAGFLSCMISAVLFGITVTQGVHYLQTFKSDGWLTTTVVIILLIADVFHTVLTTQATFVYLIKGVEDIRQLENVPWSLTSSTALAVFSDFVVRCYFARRIWFLSNHNYIVALLLLNFQDQGIY